MSGDVCMETELTRWNDVPPSMATNDVFVVCCCLLWFVYVDRHGGVFPCVTVFVVCCVAALLCVLWTLDFGLCTVYCGCDAIQYDATRCDVMGYDPMGYDTVGRASVRLVGTGTLSVDVWCVGVGARTWRGCCSMISDGKYACVGSGNEW